MNQDVMICTDCNRRTPAARASCMYCGAVLPVNEISVAPAQKNLESFEHAFNVVIEPSGSGVGENLISRFAEAMQMEVTEAQAFLAADKRLPVARCQTHQEAELIAALIRNCGNQASVIADKLLRLGITLVKARKVRIENHSLCVTHSSGEFTVPFDEIKLMVMGLLKNTRTDFAERASAIGKNSGVIDTAEFRSEEVLLDVYASSLGRSFRIKADSFDYSGLISPLSYRTEVNFQSVVAVLQNILPKVTLDTDFRKLRGLLERAWPARSHTESRGLRRTSAFKKVAEASVITNNSDQFERYSRLLFLSSQTP